jgi:hypothetical protein
MTHPSPLSTGGGIILPAAALVVRRFDPIFGKLNPAMTTPPKTSRHVVMPHRNAPIINELSHDDWSRAQSSCRHVVMPPPPPGPPASRRGTL